MIPIGWEDMILLLSADRAGVLGNQLCKSPGGPLASQMHRVIRTL